MSNKGKVRYIFTSSNTSQGFFTFIPELLEGLRRVYILKGAAGSGKSTFIRLLGESISEQGYEVEFWISAVDPVRPDGLYVPQLETAVVNGSLPEAIDPKYPGAVARIINCGDYWDEKGINAKRREIMELVDRVESQSSKADSILRNAGRVKEEIKKFSLVHLNIVKIQQLIEEMSHNLMEKMPAERHYFASAVTADGMVNYVDEISAECKKRYVFKGPPGSGKSTVINELARRAGEKGFALEYYHCGFDRESLSMVIIRDLQTALIDAGNIAMIIEPSDIIIDMSEYLDDYDGDLMDLQNNEACRSFESLLLEAQLEMENVHGSLKDLKKIYSALMDFESLDKKRQEVHEEIITDK